MEYLTAAQLKGAQKAQCLVVETEKHIMNFETGSVSMFRTSRDLDVRVTALFDGRRGDISLNGSAAGGLDAAMAELEASAASAEADPAWDIAPFRPPEQRERAVPGPAPETMHARIKEFYTEAKRLYPGLNFLLAWLSFTSEIKCLRNSNGLAAESACGVYELALVFCTKAAGKTSTFNHFVGSSKDLGRPLLDWGGLDRLLRESGEHAAARSLSEKFVGEIVVSPECLWDFFRYIFNDCLKDGRVISGTSIYRDKLDCPIAHRELSVRSLPSSPELATGYSLTKDGFMARDLTLIENGVLKSFILSSYAAGKTGLPYVSNDGECYVIEPGRKSFSELIRNVERGLLVTRFSGAEPNEKGDFSGIAKNSFYIEGGKILFPVSETMISGNIPRMLQEISGISKERVNSGYSIYPWIACAGITVSGK